MLNENKSIQEVGDGATLINEILKRSRHLTVWILHILQTAKEYTAIRRPCLPGWAHFGTVHIDVCVCSLIGIDKADRHTHMQKCFKPRSKVRSILLNSVTFV